MKTREHLTTIALGVISAFLYGLIAERFPSFDVIRRILLFANGYLSEYYPAILIFLVVFFLVTSYYKNRRDIGFPRIYPPPEPEIVRVKGIHFRFGVIWHFLYGHSFIEAGDWVYTKGPFCPKCSAEMIGSSKNWILCKKQVWICPKCNRIVYRPSKSYGAEDEMVEKSIERDLRAEDFILVNEKVAKLKDNTTYVFGIKKE